MLKLGIIGAGKVGSALAVLLSGKGYNVAAVSSRSVASAWKLAEIAPDCEVYDGNQGCADNADFVFITTPDDVIPMVARQVNWHSGQYVVHCSGAASTDILEPASKAGAVTGTMHPLQTIAGVEQAVKNMPGSVFGVEAEEPLLGTIREMIDAIGGQIIALRAEDKVAYHAAAAIACNFLVTLVKMAADLWQTFDVPREQAINALQPLIQGTLNNINNIGIPQCLTGPIARGDNGTIRKHLTTLEKTAPSLLSVYKELGLQTLQVSIEKGNISPEQEKELEQILKS